MRTQNTEQSDWFPDTTRQPSLRAPTAILWTKRSGETACRQRNSRQCGRAGSFLDAFASHRRLAADKLAEFGANTTIGRAGQPAELAPIYVLLASDASSYSTGRVAGSVGHRSTVRSATFGRTHSGRAQAEKIAQGYLSAVDHPRSRVLSVS